MTTDTPKAPQPPTASEVYAAIAEDARVERENGPTRTLNREIREENEACLTFWINMHPEMSREWAERQAREFVVPYHHMPFKLGKEFASVMRAERVYGQYLRSLPPEHWESLIDALPHHIQTAIAKIVWWDFFSERPCTDGWPHLDRYLDRKAHRLTDEEIRLALQGMGYSEYMAQERLIGVDE